MQKFRVTLLILSFLFIFGSLKAKADTIVLSDGEIVNGKIEHVLSGLIEIKTDNGIKQVSRTVSVETARDIVEVGFIKKKKLVGEVFFLDEESIELTTPSGNLKLNRYKVRNIILTQQK